MNATQFGQILSLIEITCGFLSRVCDFIFQAPLPITTKASNPLMKAFFPHPLQNLYQL
jgi:hypothetical protein